MTNEQADALLLGKLITEIVSISDGLSRVSFMMSDAAKLNNFTPAILTFADDVDRLKRGADALRLTLARCVSAL